MIQYNVTFGTDAEVLAINDFDSPEEVSEFLEECLTEHGEGEYEIGIAAFESDDEAIEDEP